MESNLAFWLAAAALLLLAYSLFLQSKPAMKKGALAPSLSLERLSDQQALTPRWKGTVTVLHFWATWCRVCRRELRHASLRAARLQKKGVRYMLINLDRPVTTSALQAELRRLRIDKALWKHHYRDPGYRAGPLFRVQAFPSLVVLNAKGEIAYYVQGALPDASLSRMLQPLGGAS